MTSIKINTPRIKIGRCPSLVIPVRGIWVPWLSLKLDESSTDFLSASMILILIPTLLMENVGVQNCEKSYSKFLACYARVSFLSAWLFLDGQSFSYQILLSVTSAWARLGKTQIPGSLIPYSICLKDMDIPGHVRHQLCLWEDRSMSDTTWLPAEL